MKYFLDCGSNLGQGYEYFRKIYGDEYHYMLFEPNESCYDKLIEEYGDLPNVKIYNDAVYIEDCIKEFHFANEFSVGGSIIENHNSGISQDVQVKSVSCVDILKIIDGIASNNNEVVIKFDIESSEYDVLEKMIEFGVIFKIRKIYCEFHSKYMNPEDKSIFELREKRILSFLKEKNICFELWH